MSNSIPSYPKDHDGIRVTIMGAGLGSFACAMTMHHAGFEVVIFEEVRVFLRFGVPIGLGEIAIGNKSPDMNIRRWGDEISMGHEVVSFDEDLPSVTLKDDRTFYADLIDGADDIKSRAGELVLGFIDAPKSSGYACYRAFFGGSILKEIPQRQPLLQKDCVNIWVGEDRHIVQNTLRDGEEFNWVIRHKDTEDIQEIWFQPGNKDDVRKLVEDWMRQLHQRLEQRPVA